MERDPKRLRDLAEKLADRYYEGPEPPSRIAAVVVEFARANPNATVEAWAEFATRMACGMYQSGWTRGFEWQSRGLALMPLESTERQQESEANDWQQEIPELPSTASTPVEGGLYDQLADDDARARYLDLLGRYYGGFRVVIDTTK
jgi:hypothetical protein